MRMNHRDLFVFGAHATELIVSSGLHNSERSTGSLAYAFDHGVASGDPLSDSVVIWTRVTPDMEGPVTVCWQVATDEDFYHLVNIDQAKTDAYRDYTIKVDVNGLEPDRVYYYRFQAGQTFSAVGRTKTLPVRSLEKVRLAVLSCCKLPESFFYVHNELMAADELDAVLHVGDYIEADLADKADEQIFTSATHAANKPIGLDECRARYAQYRRNPDLQSLHASLPFIFAWDDLTIINDEHHAFAAYPGNEREGVFPTRELATIQAYFEWLPLRPQTPDREGRIYHSLQFGDLLNLILLDSRIVDHDGAESDYVDPLSGTSKHCDEDDFVLDIGNSGHSLLGTKQWAWLTETINHSSVTWQLVEQQAMKVSMLPHAVALTSRVPRVSLSEYREIAAAAVTYQTLVTDGYDADDPVALLSGGMTTEQLAIINNPVKMGYLDTPHIPYDLDNWDSYACDRAVLYVKAGQKNLISLTSDKQDVRGGHMMNHEDEAIGMDFPTPRAPSPRMKECLALNADGYACVPERRDLRQRSSLVNNHNLGKNEIMIMTFTADSAIVEWRLVDSVENQDYPSVSHHRRTLSLVADGRTFI